IAETIPLHAELAAGVARQFDEAHFQHDLLRRHHRHRIDDLRPELAGDGDRLVEGGGIGHLARQHDAAVDRGGAQPRAGEAARELVGQPRDVVGHLDVEDANQPLALGVDRDAGGADLLAEDRDGVVGERIDVGHLRIADGDVDEAAVGAHVERLADGDQHHGGVRAAVDAHQVLIGGARVADHAQQRRRQRRRERDRRIAQPGAARLIPVRTPPREADGAVIIVGNHDALPPPLVLPQRALPIAAKASLFSTGTVYSCLAVGRVTTTVVVATLPLSIGSLPLRSLSVILRVLASAVSPALRSSSDRLPTDEASHTFCASTVLTSSVTDFATVALAARSSAVWSTASTRAFCKTTSVVAWPLSMVRVSTTSTRSPGSTKPPTPSTSLTRMVTAFMPLCTSAERVARSPAPVILSASTGSLGSIAVSTTRRPPDRTSLILWKAPAGSASCGQVISLSIEALSSAPKRSGCAATTMVWVASGFLSASMLL